MLDESVRYLIVFSGSALILALFLLSPMRSVMYIVAFQKVIDIFWFIKVNIAGFPLSVQRAVYAALPFILFPITLFEGAKRKIPFPMPVIKLLMILFVIWYALGILRGYGEMQYAVEALFKLISGLTMFGIGWFYFDDEEKYDKFAKLFIFTYLVTFSGVMLQFLGIFKMEDIGVRQQTESGTGAEELLGTERTARYPGFYNDGGTAAMYLFTALPLCLYFIYKREKPQWLYYGFFVMGITGLVLSFVRGSWLTVIVILTAWLFINKEYIKIMSGVGAVALLIAAETFFGKFFRLFFRDIFASVEEGKLVGISGKAVKIEIVMDHFYSLDFFSKLFGEGFGSASKAVSAVTGNPFESTETDFVNYLHDFGIFGFSLYYLIPTISLFLIWRHIKHCDSKSFYDNALRLKYCVSFAMFAGSFIAYFGSGTKWVSFTFPLWFLAGFALKPPAYYALRRFETKSNVIQIQPKLASQLY